MPTNDFKSWALGGSANVLSQSAYAALTTLLTNGFQNGVADAQQVNKVLRQSAAMAAMLGQFIVDQSGLDALDNGDIASLEARFLQALKTAGGSNRQDFTATGTFTVPAGVTKIRYRLWGGGGGGGGSNGAASGGAGGGGGGYSEGIITGLTPGDTIAITVGAAGTAGAGGASLTNGGNGGTSSVGAYASATGGNGGAAGSGGIQSAPPTGGTATGGALNLPGDAGWIGYTVGSSVYCGVGGGAFGCGPAHAVVGGAALSGAAGIFPGQGGSAGINGGGGSIGAAGRVILEW